MPDFARGKSDTCSSNGPWLVGCATAIYREVLTDSIDLARIIYPYLVRCSRSGSIP